MNFIALGLGYVLAWLFSIWTHLERLLWSRQKVRQKDVRIAELECKVEDYQAQIQSLQPSLPPTNDLPSQELSAT